MYSNSAVGPSSGPLFSWHPETTYFDLAKDGNRADRAYEANQNTESVEEVTSAVDHLKEIGIPMRRLVGHYTIHRLQYLLKRFIVSFPIVPVTKASRARTRHDCSRAQCMPLLELGDDVMCRWTGNIHHCPAGGCDHSIIGRSYRTCALTARASNMDESQLPLSAFMDSNFGGDDNDDAEYRPRGRDDFDTEENVMMDLSHGDASAREFVAIAAKEEDERKLGQATVATPNSNSIPIPPPVTVVSQQSVNPTSRVAHKGRLFRAGIMSTLQGLALGLVRTVLGMSATNFNNDPMPYTQIVDENILYLWTEVASTQKYRSSSLSYPFHFHCVVVLNYMIDGFHHEGQWVIPRIPEAATRIPSVSDMDLGAYGKGRTLTHTAFTNANKFFRSCMKEVIARPNALKHLVERVSTIVGVEAAGDVSVGKRN